jgi:hypothetical protein
MPSAAANDPGAAEREEQTLTHCRLNFTANTGEVSA